MRDGCRLRRLKRFEVSAGTILSSILYSLSSILYPLSSLLSPHPRSFKCMEFMMNQLDIDLLQWFQPQNPSLCDGLILVLTNGLTWIPLYLILLYILLTSPPTGGVKDGSRWQLFTKIVLGLLCVAFVASFNNFLVKPYVGRLRPCCDPDMEGVFRLVKGYCDGNYSFFSSHAANTSAVAVYFSIVIRKRWLTVCLILWCLLNCYTRLYLAQHYPSDILCGLLFGTCSALLFYRLNQLSNSIIRDHLP